jgi:hypothetical protein
MKRFIDPVFWSNDKVEELGPDLKLAALWIMTNSNTSDIGICKVTKKRFVFETGLPDDSLDRVCEALPETFIRAGELIIIRNFVRYQFGSGDALKRNNFFKTLTKEFLALPDHIKVRICAIYSEFQHLLEIPEEELEGLDKGFERCSEGVLNPTGTVRYGTDSTLNGKYPTEEQAVSEAPRFGIKPEVARMWWNARAGVDWFKATKGGGQIKVHNWQIDMKSYAMQVKNGEQERLAQRPGIPNKPKTISADQYRE